MRGDLAHALEVGRKVTAKVQWLSKTATKSRARWIHCTPLLGVNDTIGVWMVILVDDEDDGEGDHEQFSQETKSSSRLGSNYTAEALPWDENSRRANISGVSTSIWSDTTESKNSDELGRAKPRRPTFRQSSETGHPIQQASIVRPGPKIAGRAYSITSDGDRRISVDEDTRSSNGVADNRPTSQRSTFVPTQNAMQPRVKIAGRTSFDADGSRKSPMTPPGRSGAEKERDTDGRPSPRRTYKSLSPYETLFGD